MAVSKKFNKGKEEKLPSGATLVRRGDSSPEARKKAKESMHALWDAADKSGIPAEWFEEDMKKAKDRTRREVESKRKKGGGK